uniref:Uncharacterized protein n=1 Tax=Fagus sylvatica TaxID=28930 RepID=A0A2N9IXW1_FAGSY
MTGATMSSTAGNGGGGLFAFVVQVVRSQWFTVFASLLVMTGGGATYIFRLYSKAMVDALDYNDAAINLVGFYKDVGANVAIFAGLIAEVIPTWLVLFIGAAMNFGGYFMIWLAVTGKISKPAVWQMCLYIAIGADSQNFTNTAAVVTCVNNFPESRGVVIGLLKGLVGLSGAILTQLYLGIYGNDLNSLILLTGYAPAVIALVFMFTIRTMKSERQKRNELKVFLHFFYVTILLALFLMAVNLLRKYMNFPQAFNTQSALMVVALLLLPLYIVIREENITRRLKTQNTNQPPTEIITEKPQELPHYNSSSSNDQQDQQKINDVEGTSFFASIFNKPKRGEDYTILQAILSVDMLYIFIMSVCGLGSHLTIIDNFRPIGEALNLQDRTISSVITMVSIWNYFGRVYAGFVSELLLQKWKTPRPNMMASVLFMSCIGILLIAFPVIPGSYYVSSLLLGFSYGAQVTLIFTIISELFGLKHYSTLFNCGQLGSPVGAYLLNSKLTKVLYEKEASKDAALGIGGTNAKELSCTGDHCFRISFSILACVAFFAAIMSLGLSRRTKDFYKGDIYKKFKTGKSSPGDTVKRYNGETYLKFKKNVKATETQTETAQDS